MQDNVSSTLDSIKPDSFFDNAKEIHNKIRDFR